MSQELKHEYIKSIREEYQKANKRGKSAILAHATAFTKLSRKRLIRLLNGNLDGQALFIPKSGRRVKYGPELLPHVKALWFLMEQPCGKKLKVFIPRLIDGYRKRNPEISDELTGLLLKMSPATLDRLLKQIRISKGLATTQAPSSSWYKSAIPVQAKDWNITTPGFAQADTVSHCGESGAGSFASTLTVTDLDSHWTELRAIFTKHHSGVIRALRDIEHKLPFKLHTLKFDSGSEFMNFAVVSFCRGYGPSYNRVKGIEVLRSRPYRKNDNCYVEQKNLTHVRQFIGYERIESETATRILNELYRDLWCPFLNFFMPTFKLIRKERIGSKIIKKHETPKTPYERLMESESLSHEQKETLKTLHASLDPFELKEKIEEKLKLFWSTIRSEEKQVKQLKQIA